MSNITVLSENLAELASVIRSINGETTTYTIEELAPAILALPSPIPWTSWEEASWEEIYNICQARKQGLIQSWPSDIYLGKTKRVTFSKNVLGSEGVDVEIIGIDVDGPGTLTFQVAAVYSYNGGFNNGTRFYQCNGYAHDYNCSYEWNDLNTIKGPGGYGVYYESVTGQQIINQVRRECQNFYDYCDCKQYIKPLMKGTASWDAGNSEVRTTEPTFLEEYVWLASEFEMGLAEYSIATDSQIKEATQGVTIPYPLFKTDADRIKAASGGTQHYWLRSTGVVNGEMRRCIVGTDGKASNIDLWHSGSSNFCPCFAIG